MVHNLQHPYLENINKWIIVMPVRINSLHTVNVRQVREYATQLAIRGNEINKATAV